MTTTAGVTARTSERVVPLLAAIATLALPWMIGGDSPDPVASHWGIDGRPDASLPFLVDALLPGLIALAVATAPFVAARRADRDVARGLVALAHGLGVLLLGLRVVTLRANTGAATWQEAGSVSGFVVLALLAIAVLAGALGWRIAAWRPELPGLRRTVAPAPLEAGTTLVWHGTAHGRFSALVTVVMGAIALVVWVVVPSPDNAPVAAILLLAAVSLGVLLRIVVTIGASGVRVRFGPLPLPRIRVPLARIRAVSVVDVEPMAYGGWGYRAMPGVRAVVVRRGPGIRIERDGAAALVITVDDADTAAAVLGAHLAHAGRA